ncbi:transglutaminase-like cysteine peptidase [Chthonobacter albigriseus]|uniref:transglutaminase-like cysteine peptidase n=1 Tax=Chthonobacter albigriseus TaxID=1683161 RepID=UPI0015EEDF37|nr:transglutaminase-like cysteine peptidase [Chthonobacter albigriseus]
MQKSALAIICLAVAASLASPSSALADSVSSPNKVAALKVALQTLRKPTLAPMGFAVFCAEHPAQCAASESPSLVALDTDAFALISRVNRSVNAAIRLRPDTGKGPLKDVWSLEPRTGDCEDFVLTKRSRLIAAGFPASALLVAVAQTRAGEGHAVLVVRTDSGDLVLDNRSPLVGTWFNTDLTLVKIQSPDNPLRWLAL